uniref:Uncharacterized protein n=1 Tax=Hucho hucho TaxID=62062 RepID=A0A4W5MU24_9TELE
MTSFTRWTENGNSLIHTLYKTSLFICMKCFTHCIWPLESVLLTAGKPWQSPRHSLLDLTSVFPNLNTRGQYRAEETLKTFEKKDSRVKSAAATKLYFLDYDQADRYTDLAMTAGRYNPAALIKDDTVFEGL